MLVLGKCHCGNITFTLDWPEDQPDVPARACNCSFCIKHGGVWTSNPRAKLSIVLHHADLVSKYVFGTETATFHICTRCGTKRVWQGKKGAACSGCGTPYAL